MGADVDLAAVSRPEVSLRSPSIHTYSHTQQFPRIFCVNPKLVSADGGFLGPQSTPKRSDANDGYCDVKLETFGALPLIRTTIGSILPVLDGVRAFRVGKVDRGDIPDDLHHVGMPFIDVRHVSS